MHDRDARALILRQWLFENRRSLENETLRVADGVIDKRAFEQLTGSTNHQPAESGKPTSMMKRL